MAAEYGESLSDRELEITQLVAEGLTNREVAERLFLSHNTIKVHLRNIFAKTGVASRTELSMLAVQEGWIKVPNLIDTPEHENGDAATLQAQPRIAHGANDQDIQTTSGRRSLPNWPWQRWAAVVLGIALALVVLLLPQRLPAPASSTGPGNAYGAGVSAAEVTSPGAGENWQEMAPIPVRLAGMALAASGDTIYTIGGMTDAGPSGRVDIYDIETDRWREGSPRPAKLANISAVALESGILVPGGCLDDANWTTSAAVHLYQPAEDTWQEMAPLPTAVCAYALSTDGARAYLFGGWDGARYTTLSFSYDLSTNTWHELPQPQQARGFGGAALLEDRIYYVGGYDGEREWATCEAYVLETGTWESCRPMLQPRGGLSLTAIAGRLYAIGGGWHTPLGFNERYTPLTGEWSVVETPIVSEWRNLGAVSHETALFVVGGWSGNDFLNRTYRVEIMPWRVFIPGSYRAP